MKTSSSHFGVSAVLLFAAATAALASPVTFRVENYLLVAGTDVMDALTYKYSINGLDDEAGFGTNHLRFIRALSNYSLPMDTFGNQLYEPSFGNLQIGPAAAGRVPISWLGRPGVRLQTATDLASPAVWQDWPATDGLSSTNPVAADPQMFFRLVKP